MKWTPWGVATLAVTCLVVGGFVYVVAIPTSDPEVVGRVLGVLLTGWVVAALIRKINSGKDPWKFE